MNHEIENIWFWNEAKQFWIPKYDDDDIDKIFNWTWLRFEIKKIKYIRGFWFPGNERSRLSGLLLGGLRLVPASKGRGAFTVGLFVVGNGGLALLEPLVQLRVEARKVEGFGRRDGAVRRHEADVGKGKLTWDELIIFQLFLSLGGLQNKFNHYLNG